MSAEAHHEQSLSPNTTDDVDSTIVSTTPTGTPRITPGLLRPVRSTHLELATPTPAPTRHSSLAPEADPTQPTNANEIAGRGFGNTDNHRASSISAISALTIPPYQLRDSDHFEMSSEDDEDKARTKTHYDKNSTILGRYSKDLGITDRRPKNWYSTPPRTPASANTTEAPTSPRDVEGMVGLEQASIDASASTPGVRGIDTESASSTVDKARHGSGSTADSGNGERRGSEARNWEEVHAARREATATSTANPVDLTSTSQAQSGQGIFRRYPSTSTNGVKSPASVTTMNRYPSTSTGAMKSPDHGDHPATPTTAGVSQASLTHTIQRYPSTSTTAMKSPALGTSNNDSESPKSFRSFATDSTGGRAERGLHVPFLPKSLRLSIGRTSNDTARQSSNEVTPTTPSEDRKGSFSGSAGRRNSASSSLGRRGSIPVAGNGQPLKSVSEDGDFMEYDGEAEINNATTAAAARPKIVNQRASSREVVGLKEILKEDPPTTTTARQRNIVDTSPTKSKFARFLGENVRFGSKRQGIVGVPVSKEAEDVTLSNTGSENDPVGLGIYQTSGSAASYADGLRSNPVRRAASTPVRSTPARRERRVTFPGSYVDVRTGLQPEEREKEKRESIVSTPYPFNYKIPPEIHPDKRDILTLVLYSTPHLAKVKQILLPTPPTPDHHHHHHPTNNNNTHPHQPPLHRNSPTPFDDTALLALLKTHYHTLRSPLSARTLTALRLVTYTDIPTLRSGLPPTNPPPTEAANPSPRLQHLLEHPQSGRSQYQAVEYMSRLPGNSAQDGAGGENVAVWCVEGWAVRRIAGAVGTVMVLAVAATVLWAVAGVEVGFVPPTSVAVGSGPGGRADGGARGGFRGAGTRVGTGVLLGMLVLGLGWTGVGAWVVLAWMVA